MMRARCLWADATATIIASKANATVIASDSEAIQTRPQPQSPSLDRFALLAMTTPDDSAGKQYALVWNASLSLAQDG